MFGRVTRRRLLATASAFFASGRAGGLGSAIAQTAEDEAPSDAKTREILFEEGEPGQGTRDRATIRPFWFQKAQGERPSTNWPTDNVSFDYAHLTGFPNSDEPFELSAKTIEELLALSSLPRNAELPRFLFGLRGCMLAGTGDRANWAPSHRVRTTRPNHLDPRCLIGVWNGTDSTIALFKASTVPNVDLMEKQIEGTLGCNMLPTGLHHYRVGPHRAPSQPGAFRQQTPLWVVRTRKNLAYAANDDGVEWDDLNGNLPFDNIHAAMLSSRKTPPFFSSAGCQVVVGAYDGNRVPTGAWAEFRKAAGLAHPLQIGSASDTPDDGRQFEYMLMTGKEAQLVASGAGSKLRSLRYGAAGDLVNELQDKLAAEIAGAAPAKTGVFDRRTLGRVITWQKDKKTAPTGIISPEAAKMLGLSWA
jgi:endonuclease G